MEEQFMLFITVQCIILLFHAVEHQYMLQFFHEALEFFHVLLQLYHEALHEALQFFIAAIQFFPSVLLFLYVALYCYSMQYCMFSLQHCRHSLQYCFFLMKHYSYTLHFCFFPILKLCTFILCDAAVTVPGYLPGVLLSLHRSYIPMRYSKHLRYRLSVRSVPIWYCTGTGTYVVRRIERGGTNGSPHYHTARYGTVRAFCSRTVRRRVGQHHVPVCTYEPFSAVRFTDVIMKYMI